MKNVKSFKIIISISAIMFLTIGVFSAAKAEDIKKGVVCSDNGLNVRADANLKAKIIYVLKPGSEVGLLEDSGEWYKVQVDSDYGYIRKEFVSLDTKAGYTTVSSVSADAKTQSQSKTATIKADTTIKAIVLTEKGLNLREEADASSNVLELLKPGTQVDVLEASDNWCKVKVNRYTGFVSRQYLKLDMKVNSAQKASADTSASDSKAITGIVLAKNGLNLRSEANLKSKVLTIVKPDTLVNIIEDNVDWYKLKIGTLEGYAFKQFIKVE